MMRRLAANLLLFSLVLGAVVVPSDAVTNGIIAYPWQDATNAQQIFTINSNGTNKKQITFGNNNGLPWWSPTGTQLVGTVGFFDPGCQCNRLGVTVMNRDGSNYHLIAIDALGPSWSSLSQIAFLRGGDVWVMNPDGSSQQQITTHAPGTAYGAPGWSPDGTKLVVLFFAPGPPDNLAHDQLYTMNADGSGRTQITFPGLDNLDCSGTVINPATDAHGRSWSINGEIVFWSGVIGQFGQVWKVKSDGTARVQLTCSSAPINNDDPMWAPDGTKITFSTNRNGPNEMWKMNADGTAQVRITSVRAGPFPGAASWQPK